MDFSIWKIGEASRKLYMQESVACFAQVEHIMISRISNREQSLTTSVQRVSCYVVLLFKERVSFGGIREVTKLMQGGISNIDSEARRTYEYTFCVLVLFLSNLHRRMHEDSMCRETRLSHI